MTYGEARAQRWRCAARRARELISAAEPAGIRAIGRILGAPGLVGAPGGNSRRVQVRRLLSCVDGLRDRLRMPERNICMCFLTASNPEFQHVFVR